MEQLIKSAQQAMINFKIVDMNSLKEFKALCRAYDAILKQNGYMDYKDSPHLKFLYDQAKRIDNYLK